MKRNSDILLTVIVITYNQEKYIEKAIDSILAQKTNFVFEIYNRIKNLGATRNIYELLKEAKGKYIAFLEGDDYWCDSAKLQKQFDFLEKNPNYIGVAHDCNEVNLDEKFIIKRSENLNSKKNIVTFKRIEKGYLDYQMNTLVCRNIFFDDNVFTKILYQSDRLIGDRTIPLILTDIGDIYIMSDVMSCYRSCENRYNVTRLEHAMYMLNYLSKLNGVKLKNHKINMEYYMSNIIGGCIIYKLIKKERNNKYKYSDLNKFIKPSMIIYVIINMFIICVNKIMKILKQRRKKI